MLEVAPKPQPETIDWDKLTPEQRVLRSVIISASNIDLLKFQLINPEDRTIMQDSRAIVQCYEQSFVEEPGHEKIARIQLNYSRVLQLLCLSKSSVIHEQEKTGVAFRIKYMKILLENLNKDESIINSIGGPINDEELLNFRFINYANFNLYLWRARFPL